VCKNKDCKANLAIARDDLAASKAFRKLRPTTMKKVRSQLRAYTAKLHGKTQKKMQIVVMEYCSWRQRERSTIYGEFHSCICLLLAAAATVLLLPHLYVEIHTSHQYSFSIIPTSVFSQHAQYPDLPAGHGKVGRAMVKQLISSKGYKRWGQLNKTANEVMHMYAYAASFIMLTRICFSESCTHESQCLWHGESSWSSGPYQPFGCSCCEEHVIFSVWWVFYNLFMRISRLV
jgi:hypothetical protein